MNTGKETTQTRAKSPRAASPDAVKLLSDDHKKVKTIFKEIEKARKADDQELKSMLAQQVCNELTVHAKVEEEIFYPAVRELIDDDDLMNEAEVEHATAKDLIAQISEMDHLDPMFDSKLTVLSEYIDHHVKEEEEDMFAQAKKAKVDLGELGIEMQARKAEIMEEMGIEDEEVPTQKRAAKKQ